MQLEVGVARHQRKDFTSSSEWAGNGIETDYDEAGLPNPKIWKLARHLILHHMGRQGGRHTCPTQGPAPEACRKCGGEET